jgi:hypothetical protein
MLVERDNPLLLAREFSRIAGQLLNVLHALNGRYCGHPSAFKRLDALERELAIAPCGLAARLRSAFTLPAPQSAAVLRDLVEDTYDLVGAHLPTWTSNGYARCSGPTVRRSKPRPQQAEATDHPPARTAKPTIGPNTVWTSREARD